MTSPDSKGLSLLRNSSLAAVAAVTMVLSRFAIAAILARKLTLDGFGEYAYSQWLVDIAFLLCSFGVTSSVSRYLAEYRHDSGVLASLVRRWTPIAIGVPLLAAATGIVAAWLSGMELSVEFAGLLACWTAASGFWAMQTAALTGLRRFDLVLIANLVAATMMVAGAFMLPVGASPANVFVVMAAGCLAASLVGLSATSSIARTDTAPTARLDWRSIKVYGINMWITAIVASLVWSRGELPIVKTVLGDAAVGQYAAALTIYGAAIQAVMLGLGGVAPHITGLWGQGRKSDAVALSRNIMDMQLLAGGVGALAVVLWGHELVSLVFSEAYAGAALPLSVLCFGVLAFATSCQSLLLQLETNARFNRNVIVFGLVLLFSSALALVPLFGLLGAATSRAIAVLGVALLTLGFTIRNWGRKAVSLRNSGIVAASLLVAFALARALGPDDALARTALLVLGTALLMAVLTNSAGERVASNAFRMLVDARRA